MGRHFGLVPDAEVARAPTTSCHYLNADVVTHGCCTLIRAASRSRGLISARSSTATDVPAAREAAHLSMHLAPRAEGAIIASVCGSPRRRDALSCHGAIRTWLAAR